MHTSSKTIQHLFLTKAIHNFGHPACSLPTWCTLKIKLKATGCKIKVIVCYDRVILLKQTLKQNSKIYHLSALGNCCVDNNNNNTGTLTMYLETRTEH